MKLSLPLIAIAVGGAYALSSKKPATKKTTKLPPPPGEDLPSLDDKDKEEEDEKKTEDVADDLPPVEDEDKIDVPDKKQEGGFNVDINMNNFYSPYLQTNNEQPAEADSETLWISDTCLSWAVGKDFYKHVSLPEKLLFSNPKDPDKWLTPTEYWDIQGGDITPSPWYLPILPVDAPARAFAANVIDLHTKCGISPPRRSQFKSYQDYALVYNKFLTTPLGKLMQELSHKIDSMMYDHWASKYPEKAQLEDYKYYALKAIEENPSKSINDQTNIAYWEAFSNDPNMPKKIDPKNPAHAPYKEAWLRMNIYVKEYRNYIKQYGYN